MIDIKYWMKLFSDKAEQTFPNRVRFIGLQGSHGRGEATDTSDIDAVLILDELNTDDLKTYKRMLDTLPHRNLVCGFVSGISELYNWDIADLFQFCHDTTPIKGTLSPLLEKADRNAAKRAIRTGACNLYHACVHNFVHEYNPDILRALYKNASFVIRAIHFFRTGVYVATEKELLATVTPVERNILELKMNLKTDNNPDIEQLSAPLFNWAKALLTEYKE